MKMKVFTTFLVLLTLSLSSYALAADKMTLKILNSMERIRQNQETFGAASVEISLAKNEVESF